MKTKFIFLLLPEIHIMNLPGSKWKSTNPEHPIWSQAYSTEEGKT